MSYWDTSCLVKLYAPEADSPIFAAHVVKSAAVVTSEVTRFELWATLRRKEAEGHLTSGGARQALQAYDADTTAGRISIEAMNASVAVAYETIIDRCHNLLRVLALRTLDAIHLACAKVSGEAEVVATDKRLRAASVALGFKVYLPP